MANFIGVTKLANELGVHPGSISRRLNAGQTPDFIRQSIKSGDSLINRIKATKVRKEAERVKAELAAAQAESQSASQLQSRSYTPGRKPVQGEPVTVKPPKMASSTPVKPTNGNGGNGHSGSGGHEPAEVGRAEWNGENIIQAELRRTIAQANEREVKVAQLKRELVPVAQVNFWFGQRIVKARDILMRIGPELRDRLAIEDDPVKCESMIVAEVVRALNELALMPIEGQSPTTIENDDDKEDVT